MNLPRRPRRAVLIVHMATSVGWLGLTAGLLVLGITGVTTRDAATAAAAYRAMRLLVDWIVIPVALLALASGLVLSLGTHWGLARHRWVYTKFWLTLLAVVASAVALRTMADRAVHAVAAGIPVGGPATSLVIAPSVALTLYAFMTAVSVLKPWGPTRRGRAAQADRAARAHRTAVGSSPVRGRARTTGSDV